jgi:catechol 2,3-dioxygenase-like lactoylglutathione lyase family enzyme
VNWTLEVIVVPVSDVDRAKEFSSEKLGFDVDVDSQQSPEFRVLQLTPPGSGCSITLLSHGNQMEPGTLNGVQLCVADLEAARAQLVDRGVEDVLPAWGGGTACAGRQALGVSGSRSSEMH